MSPKFLDDKRMELLNKTKKTTYLKAEALQAWLWGICLMLSFPAIAAHAQDYSVLNGEWVRPDGGYVLRVSNARSDGSVDTAYFNPGPIHVAEAGVSMWKGLKQLFVKLQDKGYPGSTYTLYYFEDKDALAGFYFQANLERTFEVIFVRKPPTN
jgi:hypothetical protein